MKRISFGAIVWIFSLGLVMAAEPQPSASDLAGLEKTQERLEKKIAELDARLARRFRLLPSATIWCTPDGVLYRTAVPELYSKSLGWVLLRDGVQLLGRRAENEMKFDPFSIFPRQPGQYVAYLNAWINEAYHPISNIVTFTVPDPKSKKKPAKPAKSTPAPKAKSSTTPDGLSQIDRLKFRIAKVEDRLAEEKIFEEQQRSLPRKLTLWMDKNRVFHRDVGPEEIEKDIGWRIDGWGSLGRNARGEVAYQHYYQGTGEYTICLTSGGNAVSNTLKFSMSDADRDFLQGDADNDGLEESGVDGAGL